MRSRLATASLLPLAFALLLAPPGSEAQRPKTVRIGFLSPGTGEPNPRTAALWQELKHLGWVEGQNLTIDRRLANWQLDRLRELAVELVGLKVDVIVTAASPAAMAAKNTTGTIPIVIVDPGDPVATGLVASLARPGGNVTGVTSIATDLAAKRLQLLKEAVPKISRVTVLSNGAIPPAEVALKEMRAAALTLGVQLHSVEVLGPDDFDAAFGAIDKDRATALIVFPDPVTFRRGPQIANFAAKSRIAVMAGARKFVDAGCLMSYGPSYPEMFRRAATYVDKILKGAKPADLPVEQPMRFELAINLKTAKALGLTIPQSVLFRAGHLIQ